MLKLENIVKTYHGRHGSVAAVKNVSLILAPGTVTVLRGPSGCGKTSLLLTAGGLMAPDSGAVLLGNDSIYQLDPRRRARLRATRIGFVFQQFHLAPYLNVHDNILVPALAVPDTMTAATRHAAELAERFGLTPRLQHLPDELSTGERQRVALARALVNSPAIILADEPTGNLDEANALTVLHELETFAADGGTVLIVSHDARVANRNHRTLQMAAGELTTN